jgi:hypothetical protein
MKTPAWIWPQARHEKATLAIRAGRAVHWISALAAAIVLFVGLIGVLRSEREIGRYIDSVPLPPPGFILDVSHFETYVALSRAIVLALGLILAGRAARYALADE